MFSAHSFFAAEIGGWTRGQGGAIIATMTTLDPKLLEILVCPVTKGALRYDAAAAELISEQAQLAYPIRDGIPIMLPDEARKLA